MSLSKILVNKQEITKVDSNYILNSENLITSNAVYESSFVNTQTIVHTFDSDNQFKYKFKVNGIQYYKIILSNFITFDHDVSYQYYILSYDNEDNYTTIFKKDSITRSRNIEIKTLQSTKYIEIFIKGEQGHYFTLLIIPYREIYSNFVLGSENVSKVIKEIKFDSNIYDLLYINSNSIYICCAYKIFSNQEKYYNGIFFNYLGHWVFCTNGYNSKEEAQQNVTNGYYNINNVEYIIDYDYFLLNKIEYQIIADNIELTLSNDINKRDVCSQIDLIKHPFDSFSIERQFAKLKSGTTANGLYIQWKIQDTDVYITKFLFSNISDIDTHFTIVVYDDLNHIIINAYPFDVTTNDSEHINIPNIFVPKGCLVGINIPELCHCFGYETNQPLDNYRRCSTNPILFYDSYITPTTFNDNNYILGFGFEYKRPYTYKETNDSLLKDKKVLCIGDSITWYGFYPNRLQELTDCILYNRGADGTTVAKYTDGHTSAFVERADKPANDTWDAKNSGFPTNADYVFILGGINDWAYLRRNPTKFNFGDIYAANDKTTFCGAWKYLLSSLKNKYPSAKIYTMLIYNVCTTNPGTTYKHGEVELTDSLDLSNGLSEIKVENSGIYFSLNTLRNAIKEISTMYGCKYIDLRNLGFSAFNYADRQQYFVPEVASSNLGDGLHINLIGANMLVDYLLDNL